MIKSFRAYYIECDKCGRRHYMGNVRDTRDTAQELKAYQVSSAKEHGWLKTGRKWTCDYCQPRAKT